MKTIRDKTFRITVVVGIAGLLLAALVLFLGNGILLQPKIKVVCGTVDLKTPAKLKMELFMMKAMLQPDDMALAMTKGIIQSVRDSGLPEARLRVLLGPLYDSTNLTIAALTNSQALKADVKLEPYEERVLKAAIAKATATLGASLIPEEVAPEAVVFFEIKNVGRRDARNAHVVIRLAGKPYNVAFSTDNRVLTEAKGVRDYRVDLEAIAPNSRTKGVIWYGPGAIPTDTSLDQGGNEIVITYENGSIHQAIQVNDFFSR